MKETVLVTDISNSETKRARYLLGLSFPAEREQIESEYFADDEAFQAMLTAEDDLIDAYARGELAGEERRRFEKRFGSSLNGRDRIQFARAFAGTVSATATVEPTLHHTFTNVFKTLRSAGPLRTATIAAVIVFVAAVPWLVSDRRRMTDEFHTLRAESADLRKDTEATHESSDTERTGTGDIAAQVLVPRAKPDKRRHPKRKQKHPGAREITALPLNNVAGLLTLQTAATRDGYVAGRREDESNVILDGVWVPPSDTSQLTTVRGTVKDPNRNTVSGATVRLILPGKEFAVTRSTNQDGAYVFNEIPPRTYSIEVVAPGFKTAAVVDLVARIDAPTVVDVQLEVGQVSERVEVIAGAELTSREDATLGNRFEAKLITQLPLEAKNVPGLLTLQPTNIRTVYLEGGDQSTITLDSVDGPKANWIRLQIRLEAAATHKDYRITIKTADGGRSVTTDMGIELTPKQIVIDTPLIPRADLPPGEYVLLLMGKQPDGSFVKVAEYSFQILK